MDEFVISGFSDEIDEKITVQFETLNKLGMEYFEPRGINGKNIADITDEELLNLKEEMKTHGIKASSIGSPIRKIMITDTFKPHFEKFKRVVQIAKELGTENIRMFSFYIPKREEPEAYREEVLARLRKMCAYAKEHGVVLLHENEKGIYGDSDERCYDLYSELYSPHFKAVFDPANFVQCGVDTKTAFEKLRPYIAYMHIKDAREDGEVVPSGVGIGNMEYILSELKQSGYKGFLSLEPHLGNFQGLSQLELDDVMENKEKSNEKTFAIAFNALKGILERI